MAAAASLRALSAESVQILGSKVSADRAGSLPCLWLALQEEDGKVTEAAVAYLLYCRTSGFMVAMSPAEAVQTGIAMLDSGGGEAAATSECMISMCTNRGRAVGELGALLVDVPVAYAQNFFEAPNPRLAGVKDVVLHGFEEHGAACRPVAAAALAQGDAWIAGGMDVATADEYLTGVEADEEPELLEEEPDARQLQARVATLEAELQQARRSSLQPVAPLLTPASTYRAGQPAVGSTVPGPRRAQSLFKSQMEQGAQLTPEEWAKLHRLAGPSPMKSSAAARQSALKPVTPVAESAFAEIEKEAAEADGAEQVLAMLQSQQLDPTQQILVAQLQQNALLLRKLVGTKSSDPLVGLLSGGGDSGSGSSSGIRGCLAREAFTKASNDLVAIGEVVRANALAELGMTPDREDSSVLRRYVERRIPLAEHRLLAHFATLLAEGWAAAYQSGNAEMLGFVGKAMMFTEQVALDQGKLQLGWLLTGYPEPNAQMLFSHKHRPGLKPFSRLAAPSWVSANLAYMKDLDYLEGRMASIGKPKGSKQETTSEKEEPRKKNPKGRGRGKGGGQAPAQGAAASDAA